MERDRADVDSARPGPAAVSDFEAAARIFRRCRQSGVTPRGMVDCMMIAVAYRQSATILSWHVDTPRVAQILGVGLEAGSLHA